jgi:hypothetical protein
MYQRATIALLACLLTGEFGIFLTNEGCSRRPDALGGPDSMISSPAAQGSTASVPAGPGSAVSATAPVGFTLEVDPRMRTDEPHLVRLRIANKQASLKLMRQEMNRLDEVTAEPLRVIRSEISAQLSGENFDISTLDPRDRPFVMDEGESEWTWQVVPKRTGKELLIATIRINSLEKHPERRVDLSMTREVIVGSP